MHGGRSLLEAVLYTTGKPDNAGGPLEGSTWTWKAVKAGGHIVCTREARLSGRPGDKNKLGCTEAGLCRRPYCIQLGSPTMREAHYTDQHRRERRSRPEGILCVQGKPCSAGGPVIKTLQDARRPVYAGGRLVYTWEARQCGRPMINTLPDTWKPAHAGGHVVYTWEARQCGRRTGRINIDMEGGQGRRPHYVYKGSRTRREAL